MYIQHFSSEKYYIKNLLSLYYIKYFKKLTFSLRSSEVKFMTVYIGYPFDVIVLFLSNVNCRTMKENNIISAHSPHCASLE